VRLTSCWYDLWIGAYWDRRNRVLDVCLVPCMVLRFGTPNPERARHTVAGEEKRDLRDAASRWLARVVEHERRRTK
jgi:hypothetical protein